MASIQEQGKQLEKRTYPWQEKLLEKTRCPDFEKMDFRKITDLTEKFLSTKLSPKDRPFITNEVGEVLESFIKDPKTNSEETVALMLGLALSSPRNTIKDTPNYYSQEGRKGLIPMYVAEFERFIKGSKEDFPNIHQDGAITLPAYILFRSLFEKNSLWCGEIQFGENINGLFKELLELVPVSQRTKIIDKIKQSVAWEVYKEEPIMQTRIIQEKKKNTPKEPSSEQADRTKQVENSFTYLFKFLGSSLDINLQTDKEGIPIFVKKDGNLPNIEDLEKISVKLKDRWEDLISDLKPDLFLKFVGLWNAKDLAALTFISKVSQLSNHNLIKGLSRSFLKDSNESQKDGIQIKKLIDQFLVLQKKILNERKVDDSLINALEKDIYSMSHEQNYEQYLNLVSTTKKMLLSSEDSNTTLEDQILNAFADGLSATISYKMTEKAKKFIPYDQRSLFKTVLIEKFERKEKLRLINWVGFSNEEKFYILNYYLLESFIQKNVQAMWQIAMSENKTEIPYHKNKSDFTFLLPNMSMGDDNFLVFLRNGQLPKFYLKDGNMHRNLKHKELNLGDQTMVLGVEEVNGETKQRLIDAVSQIEKI